MALHYGTLQGRVDIFKREDDFSTPHLQIRVVDGQHQGWRVPVVESTVLTSPFYKFGMYLCGFLVHPL